jgi:hypothetical protein
MHWSLKPRQGLHHALRALALLEGEASNARLVIVGEGPEQEHLEKLARKLGVDRRVSFAGAQTHAGVALHLAAADVFLFPTERDEAAPLVLPQAMACARPVVASRTGGITEVIGESSEYGMLIPPGDVPALTAGDTYSPGRRAPAAAARRSCSAPRPRGVHDRAYDREDARRLRSRKGSPASLIGGLMSGARVGAVPSQLTEAKALGQVRTSGANAKMWALFLSA